MVTVPTGLLSRSADENMTIDRNIPVASAIVSTVTRTVCIPPLSSLPHNMLRTAFVSGIPGITSIRAVMMTTGCLSVIPAEDSRKTADVTIHIKRALVSILSTPGIASSISR